MMKKFKKVLAMFYLVGLVLVMFIAIVVYVSTVASLWTLAIVVAVYILIGLTYIAIKEIWE